MADVTASAPIGTPGSVGYVDPFAAKALPGNGGYSNPNGDWQNNVSAPDNALLVTSNAARNATATNVTKLQQIIAPNPAAIAAAGGSTTSADLKDSPVDSGKQTARIVDTKSNIPQNPDGTPEAGYGPSTDTSQSQPKTDPYDSAVSGITDPGLKAQFKSSLQNLDQQVTEATNNLNTAKALSANDPAATAAIDAIHAKYAIQKQLIGDKNKILLGKASTGQSAFGGLGQMSQDFLDNQQAKADQRIAVLASQEQDAVIKAQIAYQTQDYKMLNDAMSAYDTANKAKLGALNDLLTASNKAVAAAQAQQKIDAAAEKQAVTLDISKSSNLGASIAKNIADSGITDPDQIAKYIAGVAQEYGITNPDILSSAVTKAQQTSDKTDASLANTANTIKNRDASTAIKQQNADKKPVSSASFKVSEAISKVTPQMKSIKGEDGYIDPAKWVAARDNWMALGGTAASFKSNFIQYLNPASYTVAGYKAPAAATGSQYKLTP